MTTIPDDDLERAAREPHYGARPPFLETTRATLICSREFESLTSEIADRIEALDEEALQTKGEVRRSPGRCIVQLGPVGLTLSWLRDRSGYVSEGRLFVVEWDGQVGRGPAWSPERNGGHQRAKTAVPIREVVFHAEATGEEDWRWCAEGRGTKGDSSEDLARRCVDSLVKELKAKAQ